MTLSSEINELKNVSQHIADKLEEFIIAGTLPPGHRLIQTQVAEQFGVSRLPVRDAFAILIKKELAVPLPRKGIVVRPIRLKEVRDLFEIRSLLETIAVRNSAPVLDAADLARARALIAEQAAIDPQKDFKHLLEVDERFHRLLWSRQDNAEIDLILARVWNRIKLIRAYARGIPTWQKVSVDHHEQILAALTRREFSRAVALVAEGITRSESELTARIQTQQQPLEPGEPEASASSP